MVCLVTDNIAKIRSCTGAKYEHYCQLLAFFVRFQLSLRRPPVFSAVLLPAQQRNEKSGQMSEGKMRDNERKLPTS
jgi:hypothetical protein